MDAIIYGRDLKSEGDNVVSEERFDKIRYYLRHSLYPQGADRSEKSRLRSAATHYKLIGGQDGIPEKLMLKDKEVISDPQAQYEIAKQIHLQAHGGINKTTALIATKYHWIRIKETVTNVIKNCPECKDTNKSPVARIEGTRTARSKTLEEAIQPQIPQPQSIPDMPTATHADLSPDHMAPHNFNTMPQQVPLTNDHALHDSDPNLTAYDMTIDPQIMQQIQAQLASDYDQAHHHRFVQPGMPQFADTSHLQQHQNPHTFGNQQPDQFIHDASANMMNHDHVMDDGGTSAGLNMQPMQHVLHMDFMNSNGGSDYKQ